MDEALALPPARRASSAVLSGAIVGLLLQLPFGLAVYLVARLLLRAVERAAEVFAGSAPPPVAVAASPTWGVVESSAVRSALLAVGRFGRGPPAVPIGTALV